MDNMFNGQRGGAKMATKLNFCCHFAPSPLTIPYLKSRITLGDIDTSTS